MDVDYVWKGRAAFAEFAEAIGIPTSQIIAARKDGDEWPIQVLYSPQAAREDDPDGVDTTAWICILVTDDDGVLRVTENQPTLYSIEDVCRSLVGDALS